MHSTDNSDQNSAARRLVDVDPLTFGLRIPVRVVAPDGSITEGEGLVDTGANWTFVDVDLPPAGEANTVFLGNGTLAPIQVVQGRLEAAGGSTDLLVRLSLKHMGLVAVLGLEFLSQFTLTIDGSMVRLAKRANG